ncbi:unnamed protein product [Rotaria sordida]|uniref:Uncharacterized protein n=1 Tax=Rotaria sordida TaxID=392033 RepID=A0A819REY0_9BILA|nr:unnamed protein product [Rotaria sordida]
MDSIEKLTLVPKLKQKLLFLREREKLFKINDDSSVTISDSSSSSTLNPGVSSSYFESQINFLTHNSLNDQILEKPSTKPEINLTFPEQYFIPRLPNALLEDIEAGTIHKFAPHYTNRQVLIDTIAHDLINNLNLLYPTRKQFDGIGTAIVRKLKLPLTKDNVGTWKDAIQNKLKRKRFEHRENEEVKAYQSKYSRFGSGRPVKKMIGEVAERDRQKQIILVTYDDDTLTVIQNKVKKLRDDPQLDLNIRLQLWKETLHVRRRAVRNQTTSEILEEFPGYKDPVLSPSSPYPMVFADNTITVYTDFLSIVSATSPDDALALLLAMYVVFELNFPKNGRAIRFLYSIMLGDTRYLSNKMRTLIKEKNIEIYTEQNRKIYESTCSVSNSHSAVSNDTQSLSQASSNLSSTPLEGLYQLHNNNNLKMNTTIASAD